jgi:hypothetical protein
VPLGVGPDPLGPGATLPEAPRCQLTWPLPQLLTPLSWVDHHYPTRQGDGVMVRYDGAPGYPYDGHRGLDLPVAAGTTAMAADDGLVVYAGWDDAGGYGVGIAHEGCLTFYFHNSGLLVRAGDRVSRGQVISLTGSTGNSTGPHLHFEVRDLLRPHHAVDPYGWTGQGDDPWPWDQGVLWRGGQPATVAPLPPAIPPAAALRPPTDLQAAPAGDRLAGGLEDGSTLSAAGQLTGADGAVLRLPVQGPAVGLAACGGAVCAADLRGDVFRISGGAVRTLFTLDLNHRAAGLDCWAAAPACVLLDTSGEVYPIATAAGAPAPDLGDMPGVWPLPGAPAGVSLDPDSTPARPAGTLLDAVGDVQRFGGPPPPGTLGR